MKDTPKSRRWREWYEKNKEAVRLRKAKYRADHSAEISAYNKAYRASNPEAMKAAAQARTSSGRMRKSVDKYQSKNPERARQSRKRWRGKNPDYGPEYYLEHREKMRFQQKSWCKSNVDLCRTRVRNRRARSKNAHGSHSASDIAEIMEMQKGRCAYSWCKKILKKGYHVDHIVALACGGSNNRSNLADPLPALQSKKAYKGSYDVCSTTWTAVVNADIN